MELQEKLKIVRDQIEYLKSSIEIYQVTFGYIGPNQQIFCKIKIEDKIVTCSLPIDQHIKGEDLKNTAVRALFHGEILAIK